MLIFNILKKSFYEEKTQKVPFEVKKAIFEMNLKSGWWEERKEKNAFSETFIKEGRKTILAFSVVSTLLWRE